MKYNISQSLRSILVSLSVKGLSLRTWLIETSQSSEYLKGLYELVIPCLIWPTLRHSVLQAHTSQRKFGPIFFF